MANNLKGTPSPVRSAPSAGPRKRRSSSARQVEYVQARIAELPTVSELDAMQSDIARKYAAYLGISESEAAERLAALSKGVR
jgi:hypothetical protein